MVSRVLNLLALGFTVGFSALLLLCVRWNAFHDPCVREDTCDISEVHLCHIAAFLVAGSCPACQRQLS